MCIAVPSRVVAVDGFTATVESLGVRRTVSLMMLDEPVAVGDHVIVQAGALAVEKVPAEAAEEALRLFADALRPAD